MRKDKRKTGIARLLELSGQKKGLLLVSFVTGTIHVLFDGAVYVHLVYPYRTSELEYSANNPRLEDYCRQPVNHKQSDYGK